MSVYDSESIQTGGERLSKHMDYPTGFAEQSANSNEAGMPYLGDITSIGSSSTKASNRTEVLPRASSAEYRRIRTLCATAVVQAELLVTHARSLEDLDLGITGNALIETLRQLWSVRAFRCKKWQMGLNFLQSALNGVSFEVMQESSCRNLADAIRIIQSSELDNDDVQHLKRLLKQADLDPFNVISSRE